MHPNECTCMWCIEWEMSDCLRKCVCVWLKKWVIDFVCRSVCATGWLIMCACGTLGDVFVGIFYHNGRRFNRTLLGYGSLGQQESNLHPEPSGMSLDDTLVFQTGGKIIVGLKMLPTQLPDYQIQFLSKCEARTRPYFCSISRHFRFRFDSPTSLTHSELKWQQVQLWTILEREANDLTPLNKIII